MLPVGGNICGRRHPPRRTQAAQSVFKSLPLGCHSNSFAAVTEWVRISRLQRVQRLYEALHSAHLK